MYDHGPDVIAIVAAYKRPALLHHLLQSLVGTQSLRRVIVIDNGLDSQTEAICKAAPVPVRYQRPDRNLSCGGGIALGLKLGLTEPRVTHFCLFDDDAEAIPGAIDGLIEGMAKAQAELAVPLILDTQDRVAWYPGLQDAHAWKTIRRPNLTAEEYCRIAGSNPVPFTWAPWPVLALSIRSVRECGFPRDDFWLCAEDLEYTLRLTHRYKGVLVPSTACLHRPPSTCTGTGTDPDALGGPHYLRFCLMLQNLSYICTRLPHARRALRHLPGNYLRFFRTFGLQSATIRDVMLALWLGAARGIPAGWPGADQFKQRLLNLPQ